MINGVQPDALTKLNSTKEVRLRSAELLKIGERGDLIHFDVRTDRLNVVAHRVADVTRSRYRNLKVPVHSRWRHFEVSGFDRWGRLTQGLDPLERARVALDLVVPSVLLDAGAGRAWCYWENQTGLKYTRSEGLAIATFNMFRQGAFSTQPSQPLRTDATALLQFDAERLSRHLQVTEENPLEGLEGRASLLRSLGQLMVHQGDYFSDPPRLGNLIDYFVAHTRSPDAQDVLVLLLELLSHIWPDRIVLNGQNLGDVWRHSIIRRDDETDRLVPFHKLTQWLTYSLIEPFEDAGMSLRNTEALTGLAEYRNGGLFVDLEVLALRDNDASNRSHPVDSELVVEWRALTLALLDRLAPLIRQQLQCDETDLPLGAILEGGTWAAGRQLAFAKRPGGEPPIRVESNGTLF